MSYLTRCNYCKYQSLLARAKREGQEVTKMKDPFDIFTYGVKVYMHPPEVDIKTLSAQDAEMYNHGWYAALSDHCCC